MIKKDYHCKQCKEIIALIDYLADGICLDCRRKNSIENATGLWTAEDQRRHERENEKLF